MSTLVSQGIPAEFHKGDDFSIYYILTTAMLNGDFGNIEPGDPIDLTGASGKYYATPIGSTTPQITKDVVINLTETGRVDIDFASADTTSLDGTTTFNTEIKLVELSGRITTFDAPDLRIVETHNTGD